MPPKQQRAGKHSITRGTQDARLFYHCCRHCSRPLGCAGMNDPNQIAYEEAVLCALLAYQRTDIAGRLTPAHFTDQMHRKMFEAVTSLLEKGETVDIFSVSETAARSAANGADAGEYLARATAIAKDAFIGPVGPEVYADKLDDRLQSRQVEALGRSVASVASDITLPADERLALLREMLDGMSASASKAELTPWVFPESFTLEADTNFLIRDYLQARGVHLLYAPKDHFKSFVVVGWAMAVATGMPWLGFEAQQGPVLYIAGEGNKGLEKRFIGWAINNGVDVTAAQIVLSKWPMAVLDDVDMRAWQRHIEVCTKRFGRTPALVVIDTLSTNFGKGEENNPSDMARFIANLKRHIEGVYECSVLVVHHTGKDAERGARGGSSIEGNSEEVYYLKKPDAEGKAVELHAKHVKDRDRPQRLLLEARVQELGLVDSRGRPVSTLVMAKSLSEFEMQVKRLMERGEGINRITKSVEVTWDREQDGDPPSRASIQRTMRRLREQGFVAEIEVENE